MNNGNTSAYPTPENEFNQNGIGLTKRELIASMAMQGMCAQFGHGNPDDYAKRAVEYSDALLKELDKPITP